MKDKIHNTYNRTKPPTLDTASRTILFNFVTYHIPEAQGNLLQTLYDQLYDAVTEPDNTKNFSQLSAVLANLEPYNVRVKVSPLRRQSEIYDPFDDRVLN